jgi:hypothetical protein
MGPRELYRLWERQNWSSHEIDFTRDSRSTRRVTPSTSTTSGRRSSATTARSKERLEDCRRGLNEETYTCYTSQEMNEFAFTALSRRLNVIGVGLGEPTQAVPA